MTEGSDDPRVLDGAVQLVFRYGNTEFLEAETRDRWLELLTRRALEESVADSDSWVLGSLRGESGPLVDALLLEVVRGNPIGDDGADSPGEAADPPGEAEESEETGEEEEEYEGWPSRVGEAALALGWRRAPKARAELEYRRASAEEGVDKSALDTGLALLGVPDHLKVELYEHRGLRSSVDEAILRFDGAYGIDVLVEFICDKRNWGVYETTLLLQSIIGEAWYEEGESYWHEWYAQHAKAWFAKKGKAFIAERRALWEKK